MNGWLHLFTTNWDYSQVDKTLVSCNIRCRTVTSSEMCDVALVLWNELTIIVTKSVNPTAEDKLSENKNKKIT